MLRENSVRYINRVVKIFETEHLEPSEKALILASLAQAEATLEVADLLRSRLPADDGRLGGQLEQFAEAANRLSRSLSK